ncbi:MAG: sulfite exporter TauE/SafE family protein [Aquihabitans sp.]
MIAAVILGLAIGIALGSLGGGGSILAVPVLVYVAGQSASAATATSLVAVGAASAVGALGHAKGGHIRWGAAAAFIATGIPGSWAGAKVNGNIDGEVLLLAFSGLILVAAYRMLTACPTCTKSGEEKALAVEAANDAALSESGASGTTTVVETAPPAIARGSTAERVRALVPVIAAGTVVGFLTGLFGVGGGFVIVPALTLALGLSMPAAIATSLVVIVGNAAVSLGFRGLGAVDWSLAVPFTLTMLIGSLIGSLNSHRLPAERALQAFAILLVLVALGTGGSAAYALAT